MKILKKLGLGFFGLLTLLVLVSFLLPGKVHVERSLVIKAGAEPVYNQVNTLKNWEKWSPWHQIDPDMKLSYEGPASGVGAKYSWTSNHDEVGNGSLTIAESNSFQHIRTAMDFGDMGTAFSDYKFEPVGEGTKVTWSMDSNSDDMPWQYYIPSKYMNLFMDGMLGKDFEKGLNNLKNVVENMPAPPLTSSNGMTYSVVERNLKATPVFSIKAVCTQEELPQKLGELYKEMALEMDKHKLEFAGYPLAIYHKYDPKAIEFEACIPLNKPGKPAGRIVAKEMKDGPVAVIAHYGPYETTYDAHMAMDKYLAGKNKTAKGAPWEVYITDPAREKDPAKWLTEIYYPL